MKLERMGKLMRGKEMAHEDCSWLGLGLELTCKQWR